MTSEEFVTWLKGFAKAANEYNVTPKQWQDVKDKLDMVVPIDDCEFETEEIYQVAEVHGSDWNISITSGSWEVNYYTHT